MSTFTIQKYSHPLRRHPDGALLGTIFAHKIARERQSLFGQKCELVFVRKRTKAESNEGVTSKKDRHPFGCLSFLRRVDKKDADYFVFLLTVYLSKMKGFPLKGER